MTARTLFFGPAPGFWLLFALQQAFFWCCHALQRSLTCVWLSYTAPDFASLPFWASRRRCRLKSETQARVSATCKFYHQCPHCHEPPVGTIVSSVDRSPGDPPTPALANFDSRLRSNPPPPYQLHVATAHSAIPLYSISAGYLTTIMAQRSGASTLMHQKY